jgi:hypothetical protein
LDGNSICKNLAFKFGKTKEYRLAQFLDLEILPQIFFFAIFRDEKVMHEPEPQALRTLTVWKLYQ